MLTICTNHMELLRRTHELSGSFYRWKLGLLRERNSNHQEARDPLCSVLRVPLHP